MPSNKVMSLDRVASVLCWIVAVEESNLDPYEKHIAYAYGARFLIRVEVELSTADLQRITGISKTKCHCVRKTLMSGCWLKRNPGQHKNACARVTIGDVAELNPALARDLHYGLALFLGHTVELLGKEML